MKIRLCKFNSYLKSYEVLAFCKLLHSKVILHRNSHTFGNQWNVSPVKHEDTLAIALSVFCLLYKFVSITTSNCRKHLCREDLIYYKFT